MIELFGISGRELVFFLMIMIPFCAAAIAVLRLIIICCIRDVREVNEYYRKKKKKYTKMNPPLTYYGGKQLLCKYILPLIPPHKHYIEPFFGGGAVFWAKPPSIQETINDTNSLVVNFYKQVKNNFDALDKLVKSSLYAEDLHGKAKNIYKNKCDFSPVEQAWGVWFLSHTCINSVLGNTMRVTKTKPDTVAKLLHKKKKHFTQHIASRLENAVILNRDANKIIKQLDSNLAFFYIDPPYIDCNQGHYSGYTKENYSELLDILQGVQGKFILSSFPNEILEQYIDAHGWNNKSIDQHKWSSAKKGEQKVELLVMNYNPHAGELF